MNKSVLVIDDDPDILDAIKFFLEVEGYSVIISEKGEYISKLDEKGSSLPDIIIIDLFLTGLNGGEISKTLKSKQHTRNIPILMISAHPKGKKVSMEMGVNDFLPKPFDISVLLGKIENLTNTKRATA